MFVFVVFIVLLFYTVVLWLMCLVCVVVSCCWFLFLAIVTCWPWPMMASSTREPAGSSARTSGCSCHPRLDQRVVSPWPQLWPGPPAKASAEEMIAVAVEAENSVGDGDAVEAADSVGMGKGDGKGDGERIMERCRKQKNKAQ